MNTSWIVAFIILGEALQSCGNERSTEPSLSWQDTHRENLSPLVFECGKGQRTSRSLIQSGRPSAHFAQ